MKKQFKNKIFKLVLLLLSVVLLIASEVVIAAAVGASGSHTRTLTLNFDTVTISSCEIEYTDEQGTTHKETVTQSGQSFTFIEGAYVVVTATPREGLWPVFDCEGQTTTLVVAKCSAGWASFTQNSTLTVSSTNREYIIHALDSDGKKDIRDDGVLLYSYAKVGNEGLTIAQLTGGSLKYQNGSDTRIELPKVTMDYHTYDGWYMKTGTGEGDVYHLGLNAEGKCYMPESITITSPDGYVYIYPAMIPNSDYKVYRVDYVHDVNSPNHEGTKMFVSVKEGVAYNSKYSALKEEYWTDDPTTGGYKVYPGYQLMTGCTSESCLYKELLVKDTSEEAFRNTVKRYYTPILYTLSFNLNGNDGESIVFNNTTTEYLYGNRAEIAIPERIGYTFAGWKVEVYKDGQWTSENVPYLTAVKEGDDAGKYLLGTQYAKYEEATQKWTDHNADYASEAQEDGSYEIRLIAQWDAKDIKIQYELGVNIDLITNTNKNDFLEGGALTTFKFDAGIVIDNPTRVGWTFTGWTLTYLDGSTPPAPENNGLSKINDSQYKLAASLHAQDIVLEANWKRETYTLWLDTDGDGTPDVAFVEVQFGLPMPTIPAEFKVPQKEGYTFNGYWSQEKQYVSADGEGNLIAATVDWDIDGGADGAIITLSAKWTINQYPITIPTIEKIPTDKAQEIFITIVVIKEGIEERHSYAEGFKLPYGTEFRVEIQMPEGFKIVTWNDQDVDLANLATEGNRHLGKLFISANHTVGAAEEGMTLIAIAKPAAPVLDADVSIEATKSETGIKVTILDATAAHKYQVAILDENSNLVWHDIPDGSNSYTFENLNPGTYYDVYVRLKAIENTTLEGVPLIENINTKYDQYVEKIKDDLRNLLTENENDGESAAWLIIDSIISVIKTEANKYPTNPPPKFYEWLDARIAEAEQLLVFARFQDSKIAELEAYRDECIASGSFTNEKISTMLSKCAEARAAILGATTEEKVYEAFDPAMAKMKALLANYLRDDSASMLLTSALGFQYGGSITLKSIEDIKALRRAIADAIAQGKITADSFITVEEATKLLRALDTVAAYNFSLINVQVTEGDVFTLRLTIPEALIGSTGLQVAYYNPATGMLELLETTVEGNTIVFKAKQITNFVILADPTVDLTVVIIALGAILLCQIIAIALVLISRNKAKNSVMHASVALPMFLAIHFLPVANAELIALGLGAAVILAQIVLMWLLLSSGMIRVFKTKKTATKKQEVTAVVREEDLHADPYAAFDEELTEEPVEETTEETVQEETLEADVDAEEVIEEEYIEEAFDEELAEELAHEQEEIFDEEVVEEELPTEIEEIYDDEEFIEHAPNPYYSLDEEENVYAFDEEEAERVSDENATGAQAEETPYGDDPFDGVFGAAGNQYGISPDEAESARDQYAYEYGDTEDAPYAETEDADREETSGQGSVDPYAYVVNDESEEISEDEEMYRYDE